LCPIGNIDIATIRILSARNVEHDYSYAANDPADVCSAGAACPAGTVATAAGAGQLFPGVPYNPATFSLPENTTNQLIANLALLGAGGIAEGASLRSPLADDSAGCYCFPARTGVVTPHGRRAIDALHVGDTVLAEDPHTHTLDAEPVRAVIVDGVKPLLAVDLSDGSAITVTANHPFWVDSGVAFAGPGWLPAGQLRIGDHLRTATGHVADYHSTGEPHQPGSFLDAMKHEYITEAST